MDAMSSSPMSDMQDFFDALSAGEVERACRGLADNVLVLLPGLQPVHGRARAGRLLRLLRRRFADISWTRATSLDAEPGWMISTWTVTGTLAGGAPFRREVASVVRLDVEGKVAYLSDYFKSSDRTGLRAAPAWLSRDATAV